MCTRNVLKQFPKIVLARFHKVVIECMVLQQKFHQRFVVDNGGSEAERENRDPDRDDDSEGDSVASPTGQRRTNASDSSFTNGTHSVSEHTFWD
jgi:hypothetical protein